VAGVEQGTASRWIEVKTVAGETIRWGLLGTARINERMIPAFRASERSELLAVASREPARARAYAAEWNIPRAHGSYEAMLADPEIDAVYVSLPNALHSQWSIACAEAGKHVLCEKPLAVTPEEVDGMAEAGNRNGVLVQEASMMRFNAQTRRVQELVSTGAIGEVRAMRGIMSFSLEREVDVRWDTDLGGGSLWDLGCYPVSFMRTMMRDNPVEVQGWQVTGPTGVDLTFVGDLRFSSGAIGQFFSSFQAARGSDADLIGSTGIIHLDYPWVNYVGVDTTVTISKESTGRRRGTFGDSIQDRESETLVFKNVNGYRDEVDSMAASILDGAEPVIPLDDSRGNVATVVALQRSARERRPVSL
jgi:predicted dehydrogenase